MTARHLNPEQETEAQALFERLQSVFEREARELADLLASKADREVLGKTEFEVRDHVHRLGAQVLEAVLAERKKKATKGQPPAVRPARRQPAVWGIGRKGS